MRCLASELKFDGGKDRIGCSNAGMLSIIKKGLKMGWNKHALHALVCVGCAVIAGGAGWSLFCSRDLVQSVLVFMAGVFCSFRALSHLVEVFSRHDVNT